MIKPLLAITFVLAALGARGQTLVAHYTFDGNANDVSAFANNATVGGARLTTGYNGRPNSAYLFDGVNDSIVASAAAQLNTPNASYAMWIRVDSLLTEGDGKEYYIFSHGGWQNRVKMSLPGHGYPVFTTNTTTGIKDGDSNPEKVVEGEWTHLTFVRSADTNYIYFNGRFSKFDLKAGTLNPTDRPLGIGSNPIDGGAYFKGAIDDVRVFGEGLRAAQVAALYASLTSSVQEVDFAQVARVYPNPARSELTLEYHGAAVADGVQGELFDARGARVRNYRLASSRVTLPLAELPAGLYLLRLNDGARSASTRILVQ